MILAAKYARENKIPYLGICLGMQISVIEISRSVCFPFDNFLFHCSDNSCPYLLFSCSPAHLTEYWLDSGFGRSKQWRVWPSNTTSCCNVHAWGMSSMDSLSRHKRNLKLIILSLYAGFKNTHGEYNETGFSENFHQESWLYYFKAVCHL